MKELLPTGKVSENLQLSHPDTDSENLFQL